MRNENCANSARETPGCEMSTVPTRTGGHLGNERIPCRLGPEDARTLTGYRVDQDRGTGCQGKNQRSVDPRRHRQGEIFLLTAPSIEGAQEHSLGLQPQVWRCKKESALTGAEESRAAPLQGAWIFYRLFLGLKPQALFHHPYRGESVGRPKDEFALLLLVPPGPRGTRSNPNTLESEPGPETRSMVGPYWPANHQRAHRH